MTKLKELSPEQRQEQFISLKARFEKHMNRHKDIEWAKVKQSWNLILNNCGHSMKWIDEAQTRKESRDGKAAATAS